MIRKTTLGSELTTENIPNSLYDVIYSDYLNKGFRNIYYENSYQWSVFNPATNLIVSNTEGDLTTLKPPSKKIFIKELVHSVKWANGEDIYVDEDTMKYLKLQKTLKVK